MDARVGCCGFRERRSEYFREFGVVEVQRTFYQPPEIRTLERWRWEAPEGFESTLKAWQRITHGPQSPTYRKRGVAPPPPGCGGFGPTPEVAGAWDRTRSAAVALGARWVLFECPASFGPDPGNIRNLERFFSEAERGGLGFAWEPRGEWPQATIEDLCRRLWLVHAVDPFRDELRARLDRTRPAYILFNNAPMLQDARALLDLLRS